MMTAQFPYKVGDRVRHPSWPADDFFTITAIGHRLVLGLVGDKAKDEHPYDKHREWQPYIAPVVEQHRWETVPDGRPVKIGGVTG